MIKILNLLILCLFSSCIVAETIAIIGTGNVASALGPAFAKQGHEIVYGSRNPSNPELQLLLDQTLVVNLQHPENKPYVTSPREAAEKSQVVVLAVPGSVVSEVVLNLGDLTGKIVIDPTNSRVLGDDGHRVYPVETSYAEIIQDLVPESYVVKAFNTLNYRTMIDPDSSGGQVTIPIVGNHKPSKDFVANLIRAMGLEAIDLGPVRFAHILEGMLFLYVYGREAGTPFNYHLRIDE